MDISYIKNVGLYFFFLQ